MAGAAPCCLARIAADIVRQVVHSAFTLITRNSTVPHNPPVFSDCSIFFRASISSLRRSEVLPISRTVELLTLDGRKGVFDDEEANGSDGHGTATIHVLLIRYEPHLAENKVDAIHAICARAGVSVQEAVYNLQSPAGNGRSRKGSGLGCNRRL